MGAESQPIWEAEWRNGRSQLSFEVYVLTLRNAWQRTALREGLALCFKKWTESTFGGHLSLTGA